jgi:hypothetical protein
MRFAAPPGSYRIALRLGSDVFHEDEIDVVAGETTTVAAKQAVELSRWMGPIQGGVVFTRLALLGVARFAAWRPLSGYERIAPPSVPAGLAAALSLVVTTEGEGWAAPLPAVLDGLRFRLGPEESWSPLAPLGGPYPLLDRIRAAVVAAPARPLVMELCSELTPPLRIPAASLAGHATVVTVALRSDGSVGVGQHLAPLEAADVGRLRRVQIGQLLYQSGELLALGRRARYLDFALQPGRFDPLLSAMAFFALARLSGGVTFDAAFPAIAGALADRFGALPDSRVVAALASPDRSRLMAALLDEGTIPLLAESARFLAEDAVRLGRGGAAVVEWARRIPSGSIWAINFD